MKIHIAKNGGLIIQPETDFELEYIENIGCHVRGILTTGFDVSKCHLTIKSREPHTGQE